MTNIPVMPINSLLVLMRKNIISLCGVLWVRVDVVCFVQFCWVTTSRSLYNHTILITNYSTDVDVWVY